MHKNFEVSLESKVTIEAVKANHGFYRRLSENFMSKCEKGQGFSMNTRKGFNIGHKNSVVALCKSCKIFNMQQKISPYQ
jgi:hypothetical protein